MRFAWSATDRIAYRRQGPATVPLRFLLGKWNCRTTTIKKNRVVVLPLKYGKGHPMAGHPVSDVGIPPT